MTLHVHEVNLVRSRLIPVLRGEFLISIAEAGRTSGF